MPSVAERPSEGLNRIFLALADPTRRAVIARLGQGPASVSELAGPSGMGLPSFIKHIRLLENSGMIRTTKSGRTRTCTINGQGLSHAEHWLAEQRAIWERHSDRLEAFEMQEQAEGTARNAERDD
ncbi:helix-turn-helix transcriptional regulator [Sphingosinicella sp. CPCC 101087]|uniref:ArsR/SmtB family transcription factor n=1 Tax=Sphingosinicella sp. CPCC 101087 TaxID=2497754 RepID=UPI00101DE3F8|nr:metalloregulator ArsR/SmtB family transcription factor [Sphingosinicella sp. CPCC 101087]